MTPTLLRALRCLDNRYPGLCLLGPEQGHNHREAEAIRLGLAEKRGVWVMLTDVGRAALAAEREVTP